MSKVLILVCLLIVSCATTPDAEYNIMERRDRAVDNYTQKDRECREDGGVMIVRKRGRLSRASDIESAKCGY